MEGGFCGIVTTCWRAGGQSALWLFPYRSRGQLSGDRACHPGVCPRCSCFMRRKAFQTEGTLPTAFSLGGLPGSRLFPLWSKGQAHSKHQNIPEGRLHELSSKNSRMEPFTASSWTMSGPQESGPLISLQTLKLPLNLRLSGQESNK